MLLRKSSRSNGGLTALALGAAAAGLGGCVEHVKRSDTVTLVASNAQAWNKVVHTTDPWPPYVMDTNLSGDGQRTARAIQRYTTGAGSGSGEQGAATGAAETAPSGAQ
ncbi:hypothetical protein [Microvirga roseola]|uniref:hypothetical protein n=1 Tax=Microvirga roseola TaxID=2883126 RepID=UPI001E5E9A90|nr:hypothetical protein [Microvirga roseola]